MSNKICRILQTLTGALISLPMLVSAETVFEEISVTYDGGGQDPVNSAAVDVNGSMYITGGRTVSGGTSYYIAKYDSYGREEWVRIHSTGQSSWFAHFNTMTVDRNSNAYVALSESSNFGKILKYDADGNETVLVEGGGIPYNYDHRVGLELDKNENNLYLRASYSIKKISLNGGADWTQLLHNLNTWVRDIAVDDSGNVYAVGRTQYLTGNGTTDVIVKKFDSNGNEIWVQHWYEAGKQNEDAYGLELDSNGNVYILVQATNFESSCSYCTTSSIVSFSSNGDVLGSVVLNGTDGYLAGNIKVADDKVYVTMQRKGTTVLIAQKLNTDLSLAWSTEYSGSILKPKGLDVDGLGNVVVGIQAEYGIMSTVKFDMYGTELWTQNGDGNDSSFVKFGTTGEVYAAGSKLDAFMYRYGVTQLICQ